MSRVDPARRARGFVVGAVLLAGALSGCNSESGAPTKIYEGGGTIPEIVDQPEPAPAKPAKKK